MVPMFIRATQLTPAVIDKMDVLSQKIIPKIDGIRCVKEIATEVEIDTDLVMRCVRNLHFYECVSLVPLFLYSNIYVATEKLHDFYTNPSEIEDCLHFVRIRLSDGELGPVPKFGDVFRLFMSLKCGITMRDWCESMVPRRYNVDERRMVQFGMHHQFLRKLSTYPIPTIPPNEMERAGRIYRLCDGTRALEDLAVIYDMMPEELHYISYPGLVIKMTNSKLVLYSYWRSSCAWRVRIALNLKKLEYDYKTVNLLSADDLNEFAKLNPAQKVPALLVGGTPITESIAIIEYLDEVYPDRYPLLPKDPIQRAQSRAIALQIAANIQPIQNIRILKYVGEQTPGAAPKWASYWLTDGLRDLEAMVSRTCGVFAVGDKVTIADLCIPSIMYNAKRWNVDVSQFPNLCKIESALSEIPEFEAAHPNNQPDANLNV
ncbi:maleylacetoacetate isomerase [Dictyocaulus viviparus]|uniref:maleylacetoacetate isomerase n=1 Tax=Dictyocaulus viviparus TaxID=29172 RepID=A0A0D8XD78_DICVI|nr:maleylacetoacetate isomerase [Dictyocaulus viviparus]